MLAGDAPWVDDDLRSLVGVTIPATSVEGSGPARFRLDHVLGEGASGVAFFATRISTAGESPFVMKVFRPALVLRSPETAEVSRRKELGAMRRLNERVPPCPYVVRMIDAGELAVAHRGERPLTLPWIASEYVPGGPEGTTLTERIARSVEVTGVGFDPDRVLRTLTCVVEGLTAIHECGVIHRDIKPDNVLLCGFAETEIAKITDFGVARAQGFDVTFGPQPVGTLGYAAPEQLGLLSAATTPATDTFALGVLLYRMLTAEEYFRRIPFTHLAIRRDDGPDPRPHLRDAARLHPDVARQPHIVTLLDAAIRKATCVEPQRRFASARSLLAAVHPALMAVRAQASSRGRRSATRERLKSLMLSAAAPVQWTTRHHPGDDRVLRALAWEPDGRAFCIGRDSLGYWDGVQWFHVAPPSGHDPRSMRFAHRVGAGKFLVGGGSGTLFELSSEQGWTELVPRGEAQLVFERATGSLDHLLLLVGTLAGAPVLYVVEQGRWRTPLMLAGAVSVNDLSSVGEHRWVLVGRSQEGGGWLGIYDGERHAIVMIDASSPRPLLAVAGDSDLGHTGEAYAVGPAGTAFRVHPTDDDVQLVPEYVMTTRDLSAVAIDPAGTVWAAAQGRVLKRITVTGAPRWEAVHNFDWLVPAVGLHAGGGAIYLATVDGAVLEGRNERMRIDSVPSLRPSQL